MPASKTKMKNAAIAAKMAALPSIRKELIDPFVGGPMPGVAVNAATVAFKKAMIERALGAEMSHHLGYPNSTSKPEASPANQRNGRSAKTVLTNDGPLRIAVPRDRARSFYPVLIPKHERRFTGFDDMIVAMYARSLTMREIQGFLLESYGVEVSPEFIRSVTDAVMPRLLPGRHDRWRRCTRWSSLTPCAWRSRRTRWCAKAIYLTLGVLPDGARDIRGLWSVVCGLWIESTEGAKFWMKVFNDLKTRGINGILIAVILRPWPQR